MAKTMLINVTHVEESRVAILDDGELAAYEIETINRTSIKGNIYNSVVESVHPSLEAAFVKIAPDQKGFLPLDGVNFKLLPQRRDDRSKGRIGQHLHPGQRLITQVGREPFAGKPPSVTTYFSLPGRYLVLMPGVDSEGISKKIDDAKQRDRLKKIVDELKVPDGFGVIVRTAGLGQTKTELQRDLRYLLRLWESIQKGSAAHEFPSLVYRERDLVIRTIRDHFTPDIKEVWVDSEATFESALEFVRDVMPARAKTLKLYTGDRPLFNKFNLEEQIERIYKRRVPLASGGEIVIDGTEALTAIDVNSARSAKGRDAEESATQTNLEAAAEIARQLRLRDLGGLIVVDFIDMSATRNVKKVETAMRAAMKGDRARYDMTRISKLGLLELSRQRIKGAKIGASYATCPACEGYGLVKNVEVAALSALRKLQTRCARGNVGKLTLKLPPDVANWIQNHKREELAKLERRYDLKIAIEPDEAFLRHETHFDSEPRPKPDPAENEIPSVPEPERVPDRPPEPPAEASGAPQDAAAGSEENDPGDTAKDAGTGRKRRRRRRRSSGRGNDGEGPQKASTDDESRPDEEPADRTPADDSPAPSAGDGPQPRAVSEGDGSDKPEGESPPKKRRRRRRRGRGGAKAGGERDDAPDADQARSKDEEVRSDRSGDDDGPIVPNHVRSDELMPAAVGGARSGSRRGRGGARRRGGGGR